MQFGGNAVFQWALGVGGLAIVVPLSFAVLIGSGAWLGRVWLGEPITPRSAFAMLVLITSIAFLSVGAGDAAAAMTTAASAGAIAVTVVGACLSGLAYGLGGVVMRGAMTRDVPLVVVLLIMSATGVLGLGLAALIRLGPDRLLATSPRDLQIMLAAGTSNAVAFYCLASALKYVSVLHANLVNASQIAMSAAAGVLMFAEPLTVWTVLGCGLTVLGLLLMDARGKAPKD
jgi:drug/metabolite transporter (DMT)-like permease